MFQDLILCLCYYDQGPQFNLTRCQTACLKVRFFSNLRRVIWMDECRIPDAIQARLPFEKYRVASAAIPLDILKNGRDNRFEIL